MVITPANTGSQAEEKTRPPTSMDTSQGMVEDVLPMTPPIAFLFQALDAQKGRDIACTG